MRYIVKRQVMYFWYFTLLNYWYIFNSSAANIVGGKHEHKRKQKDD